jgi:hypothetical protein
VHAWSHSTGCSKLVQPLRRMVAELVIRCSRVKGRHLRIPRGHGGAAVGSEQCGVRAARHEQLPHVVQVCPLALLHPDLLSQSAYTSLFYHVRPLPVLLKEKPIVLMCSVTQRAADDNRMHLLMSCVNATGTCHPDHHVRVLAGALRTSWSSQSICNGPSCLAKDR